MFEVIEQKSTVPRCILSFCAQQLAVILVPAIFTLTIAAPLGSLHNRIAGEGGPDYTFEILALCPGLLLGALVARLWPTSARSGRWVWILPCTALISVFASRWRETNAHKTLRDTILYFAAPDDHGIPAIAVFLSFTLPAVWSVTYSLIMFRGFSRRSDTERLSG